MSSPRPPIRTRRPRPVEKLEDTYGKALEQFTEVLRNKNDMYDAWNKIGFIHLHFGAYRESIDDYNHALALKPDLQEAIEHRGEAFMAVDRLDEAKAAYMDLFFHARPLGGSNDGEHAGLAADVTAPRRTACARRTSTPSTNGCRNATASPRPRPRTSRARRRGNTPARPPVLASGASAHRSRRAAAPPAPRARLTR